MAHRLFSLLVITLAVAAPVSADNPFADAAPERLIEYIQVDTINPPGNEINGANFFARYLKQAGIEYTIEESAPGRGNIWARLKGGKKPGLVLLNHMDVVPANEKYWSVDPYAGVVKDGFIYGRGALDMKGLGIAQFQAFLGLATSGKKLNRDVWFIATADEEAGGQYGAGWLAEAHPKIFRKVGYLLNEGGGGSRLGTDVRYTVEVTQKVPLWLRLKAVGRPGHGSSPQVQTAVTRLLRAGYRITTTPFEARAIEPVAAMFSGIADSQPPHFREYYRDIAAHVGNVDFMMQLQLANPSHHALLRNACSATILEGSAKINVVPAEAFLELDCRLLPDQDVDTFVNELSLIIADPNIQIERIMNFSPAISSHDTDLFRLITAQISEYYPGSSVIPGVSTGFTDSHFFRDMGITSYGFGPFLTEPVNYRGVHGNDEKIGIETLKEGTRLLQDIIETFATETR